MPTVLSLETSCDETAVAVVTLNASGFEVIASRIASQVAEHSKWGGVVPEIASRRHVEAIPHLLSEVLEDFGQPVGVLDAIAATVAPGLAGALMVGSITGRTLAALHSLPFLGIHHLEGHLASILLTKNPPKPPYLVLLVSGGHTELIRVEENCFFKRLGRSHDDAAGEAFDKIARLLGLPYPGGPSIERVAQNGNCHAFSLPKGRVSRPEGGFYPYDFSFSGLKTAMLRQVQSIKTGGASLPIEDLAASFEQVVAEVLVERSMKCVQDQNLKSLVLVGGVAANQRLRKLMKKRAESYSIEVYCSPKEFCTDNAAMVGAAALKRLELKKDTFSSLELGVCPRLPLDQSEFLYDQEPPF